MELRSLLSTICVITGLVVHNFSTASCDESYQSRFKKMKGDRGFPGLRRSRGLVDFPVLAGPSTGLKRSNDDSFQSPFPPPFGPTKQKGETGLNERLVYDYGINENLYNPFLFLTGHAKTSEEDWKPSSDRRY